MDMTPEEARREINTRRWNDEKGVYEYVSEPVYKKVIEPYVVTFLTAVRCAPGCKHPVESYYPPEDTLGEDYASWPEPSWKVAEENGWANCTGGHKWELTPLGIAVLGLHEARAFGLIKD
jgi:hypothetical protein